MSCFFAKASAGGGGPPTPGILWWKTNDGSGTTITADVGPNGTTAGGWTTSVASGSGQALTFDGTANAASSNSAISYGGVAEITVCFWVYGTLSASTFLLESNSSTTNGTWRIYGGSTIHFEISQSAGILSANKTVPSNNTWHHLGVVFGNATTGKIKYYRNAVDQAVTPADTRAGPGTITDQVLYVGARNLSGNKFTGRIDDLRIYSGELTAQQILDIYNAGPA